MNGPQSHMSISGDVKQMVPWEDYKILLAKIETMEKKIAELEEQIKKKKDK